jgi:hypothetical protein
MNDLAQERRDSVQTATILAVSRDNVWLQFAEKTLRRTDRVKTLTGLEGDSHQLPLIEGEKTLLLISSELVPSKIKEFQAMLSASKFWKVWVLRESHDEHQRISDKHLKEMGIAVADRPDNSKAFRRLLKIIFD